MMRRIIAVTLLLSFNACAFQQVSMEDYVDSHNTKRLTAPPPGKGLIYVIRKPRLSGSGIPFDVFLDSKQIGRLPNRSYLNLAVEPGEHKISVFEPEAKRVAQLRRDGGRATVQAEMGRIYYLQFIYKTKGFGMEIRSEVLDAAQGQAMLAKSSIRIFTHQPEFTASLPSRTTPSPNAKKPLLSDIDTPGYRSDENPDDFAVVVGIDDYKSLPSAQFAERDAEAMKEHLVAMGYPERQVVLLKGENATRAGLQKYLGEWLPRNAGPSSNIFFYYSGHGAPDTRTGKAYLVPWDGDASFLKSTAYPVEQLYAALKSLKAARVIVALDACFSGAGGRSVLAEGARPLVTKVDLGKAPGGKLTLLTAASGDEITATLKDEGHGIFTYFLLKGLNGEAKNPQGSVTAKGLYDYLRPKVQREARLQNREQTPTYHSTSDVVLRDR